jgi:phospholipase/carboxylesterase
MKAWIVVLAALAVASGCRPRRAPPGRQHAAVTVADLGGLQVQVVSTMGENERGGPAIVFLHGYGGTPQFFVPYAQTLAERRRVRVFLPAAPLPAGNGFAWWSFAGNDWPGLADGDVHTQEPVPQLQKVRAAMQALLREVRDRYAPERLVLGGHSQGGLLSLDLVLDGQAPVDGVAVLSGGILAASIPGLLLAREHRPPVLVAHGRKDAVLAFAQAELHKSLLEKHGYAVTWHPFDGGHRWPPEQMFDDLERLLSP